MARLLKTDGSTTDITDLSLERMQAAVGGYVEVVRCPDGSRLLVNEEGLIDQAPFNALAVTSLLHAGVEHLLPIVGDAVLLAPGEAVGDW